MPTWPKGDDRCGCVSGFHNGNVHPEEDAGLTQTINTRSLHQIVREVAGVLAEHHDQERGGEMLGRMNAHTLFSKSALDIILNKGTIVATCGTIMASSRTLNSRFLFLS